MLLILRYGQGSARYLSACERLSHHGVMRGLTKSGICVCKSMPFRVSGPSVLGLVAAINGYLLAEMGSPFPFPDSFDAASLNPAGSTELVVQNLSYSAECREGPRFSATQNLPTHICDITVASKREGISKAGTHMESYDATRDEGHHGQLPGGRARKVVLFLDYPTSACKVLPAG
jgi:hypothetical protein